LFEGVHIPRTELKNSAEKQVEDKGPFPSKAIRKDTKYDLKERKGVSINLEVYTGEEGGSPLERTAVSSALSELN
jgi:hypothetical protein